MKNEAGEVGFKVLVGGGMGRTPVIATLASEFVPWQQILVYIEAIVRVYNRYGRRDNIYKARIKILVKAEGTKFFDAVNAEFAAILERDTDGAAHLISQPELDRVSASFVLPPGLKPAPAGFAADASNDAPLAFTRWCERNVHAHRLPGYRAVTLSLKRAGQAPGDATDEQMEQAAAIAERFSQAELRVTHDQNLLLPWVRESDLFALWQAAKAAGFANPNIGLLTDMIACPGGDFCALANARSIPMAAQITERFTDLDELYDIGDIDLHISGCINSCGHHHSGHIGILGVDKDGTEWYQVTLGGSDGKLASGASVPGKVIGPSFAADEVADVIEAVIDTYRRERQPRRALHRQRAPPGHGTVSRRHRRGAPPPPPPLHRQRTHRNCSRRVNRPPSLTMQFIDSTHDHWHAADRQGRPAADARRRAPRAFSRSSNGRRCASIGRARCTLASWCPTTSTSSRSRPTCRAWRSVALQFPKWIDGRAYSQARMLRRRLRFEGEVRATGEVLVDMLPLLQRTGFDAAATARRPEPRGRPARAALLCRATTRATCARPSPCLRGAHA